jgi:hypothetical protein
MWVLGLVVLVDEIDKNIVRGMITPLKNEFGVGDLGISVMLSLALLLNGLVTVPAAEAALQNSVLFGAHFRAYPLGL